MTTRNASICLSQKAGHAGPGRARPTRGRGAAQPAGSPVPFVPWLPECLSRTEAPRHVRDITRASPFLCSDKLPPPSTPSYRCFPWPPAALGVPLLCSARFGSGYVAALKRSGHQFIELNSLFCALFSTLFLVPWYYCNLIIK